MKTFTMTDMLEAQEQRHTAAVAFNECRNEQTLVVKDFCTHLGCTERSPAALVTEDMAGNLHVVDAGFDAECVLLKLQAGDQVLPPDPLAAAGIIRVKLQDGTQYVIRKGL